MNKILNESNLQIGEINNEKSIKVDFSNNYHLFAKSSISEKMDLLEEYNLERDNCQNFRLIFTISPFCSNILFNTITEVVKNEGSNECECQNFLDGDYGKANSDSFSSNAFSCQQAIRDTEYTNPKLGGYTYHCGLNILNNHRLRSKDFIHINNVSGKTKEFNTILDYARDIKGKKIKKKIPVDSGDKIGYDEKEVHVYSLDNIMNFKEAYKTRVQKKNDWWGFLNTSTIDIPVTMFADRSKDNRTENINKVINDKSSCELIDFYPDRSLYSFTPNYNKFREREEKNWDYCLTYPFKSDKETFNKISCNNINGIKIINASLFESSSGTELIQFKTQINHNLLAGSSIRLWMDDGSGIKSIPSTLSVKEVGDLFNKKIDTEHYFALSFSDLKPFIKPEIRMFKGEQYEDYKPALKYKFFLKRTDNRCLCEYYFRIFKKISNEGTLPKSTIGRIAYAETIYGDNTTEIVYTDYIDGSKLKDNRGRDISSIYMTILKRNAGRKEWYNGDTKNEKVEYSHCFGKLTSGLKLPIDETDYNVLKLHNVDCREFPKSPEAENAKYYSGMTQYFTDNIENFKLPEKLEDDITIEEFDEFYGDIVEYDPYLDKETVIENVYHRFNTEQREHFQDPRFFHLLFDELIGDDYDIEKNAGDTNFRITTVDFSKKNEELWFPDNIFPEGYYYQPHYEVKLKDLNQEPIRSAGKYLNVDGKEIQDGDIGYFSKDEITGHFNKQNKPDSSALFGIKIKLPKSVLAYNDRILFYDKDLQKNYYGKVIDINGYEDIKISIGLNSEEEISLFKEKIKGNRLNFILMPYDAPEYASFLNNTSHDFVWRPISKYSELETDNELYNYAFSNGCIYVETPIRFYLRRQDPFGYNGMRTSEGVIRELNDFVPFGEEFKEKEVAYIPSTNNITCG